MKSKRTKIILGIIVLLVVGYVGYEVVQLNRAKTMLAEGMAAFDNERDCSALRSGVIGSRRISYNLYIFRLPRDEFRSEGEARSDFCYEIIQVEQMIAEQDYAGVILHHQETLADLQVGKYVTFGSNLTAKTVDEFSKLIDEQLLKIDEKSEPDAWADVEICIALDDLLAAQVVPNAEANLPDLYLACGDMFLQNDRYGEATVLFRRFLSEYPNHERLKEAKDQIAFALLRESEENGGGGIGQPQFIGTRKVDTAVLIQNDSIYEITMVFSGIENRVETLEPCFECRATAETECSTEAAIETYVLPPGTYEVVVSADSDRIRPFRGTWTLKTGEEYFTCFYVDDSFAP